MGASQSDQDRPGERLTVAQCADQLGISEDAVRSRIKRGTLRVVRESGTVYVLLDADQPTTGESTDQPTGDRDQLIYELKDRVRSLEESNRENRRIIAGLVQRIPELEAPPQSAQEAEDVAESAAPGSGRPETPEASAEPRTGTSQGSEPRRPAQRAPWWRRIFGIGE